MGIHLLCEAIPIATSSKWVNDLLIMSLTSIQTLIGEKVNAEKIDTVHENCILFNY